MLMHSQDRKGVYQDTHVNTMLQEYISLAYHSTINNYKGFAAKIETNLDTNVGNVKIIPQDLGRVFLNVVSNSLYALYNKKRKLGDSFEPMLTVRTINNEDNIEIIFRDNGTGIPQEMMDKIFNPFFTTKPAGEGTGLGLSICYDIVRNIHKGEIQVDSKEGEYTDFSIFLPKHVDSEENENGESENVSYQR
jgi:signal transduction histidine kinase